VIDLVDEGRRPADPEGRHLGDAVSIAGLQARLPGIGDDAPRALRIATRVVGGLSPGGVAELVDAQPVPGELLEQALTAVRRKVRPSDLVARADRLITRTLAVAGSPVVTTSLQLGGLVLVDLIRRRRPDIPVVFVDTGYHFPETLEFRDRVAAQWGLDLVTARPDATRDEHEAGHGTLYATDPARCCAIRKVAPADAALAGRDVWFTALRRDQAATRSAISPVEPHVLSNGTSITKVNALAGWTWRDLELYALVHEVPRHPLYDRGYTSIGCAPCTRPTGAAGDDRSGRWNGTMIECGLHIDRSRVS
jgi:phosphoadenosine phosphosulfate reductase